MTRIAAVLAVPATGAGHCTDLRALQDKLIPLDQQVTEQPVTPGFDRVREVAEAVSVGLVLDRSETTGSGPEAGGVVWGDCVSVAHPDGSGGEPVFRASAGLRSIRELVAPTLRGQRIISFRELADEIESLTETVQVPAPKGDDPRDSDDRRAPGVSRRDLLTTPLRILRASDEENPEPELISVERPLHAAVRYGVSQALLQAAALCRGGTMAEVISAEWGLPLPDRSVPVHSQGQLGRRTDADRMIVRRADSLGQGLLDGTPDQLGTDGSALIRHVRWLKARADGLAGPDYRPAIHLDLHGALGRMYDNNLGRILGYIHRLQAQAHPYPLRVESPLIMGSRDAQIEALGTLREYVQFRRLGVEIVADEWINTLDDVRALVEARGADMAHISMPALGGVQNSVEAVLTCQEAGIGTLLGGSCTETDLSARVGAQVALATQPDLVMAKPGSDIDGSICLIRNEMARTLAWISLERSRPG